MISSGQAPDVINIATEGVEYGLSKHLFLDLNNYIKQDKGAQALLKDQYPPVVQGFTKNGSTYLIPNNWNTNLVFYNTDMFAAAGIPRPADNWTWADFEADAKKLTQGSGGSKVYGIGLGTQTFAYMPWIYSNDGSTASADLKEPTLDSPATVGAVQFLADLVKNGYAPNPTGSDPAQLFQSGKVAMATPAGAAGFAAALDADPGVKWDVLPLPGNKSQENVFGAAGFAIYKNSKNKDLAWELTKELGGEGTQKAWAESFSSNPTTLTALKSAAYIKGKPHADLFWDLPKGTKPVAAPTFYTSLDAEFQKALSSIYAGGDVKSALTTANNNVKTTIANNG
jgi:multiple sugar transport system substrate-binding protein